MVLESAIMASEGVAPVLDSNDAMVDVKSIVYFQGVIDWAVRDFDAGEDVLPNNWAELNLEDHVKFVAELADALLSLADAGFELGEKAMIILENSVGLAFAELKIALSEASDEINERLTDARFALDWAEFVIEDLKLYAHERSLHSTQNT